MVQCTKKALTCAPRRPYNVFCAVQQSMPGQRPGSGFANTDSGREGRMYRSCQSGSSYPPLKGQPCTTQPNNSPNSTRPTSSNAIKLASLSIENAEKLVQLNINAAKLAIAQAVEGAQAAASVKDVQELLALRAKLAEVGVQSATGYSRTLYELSSEAQAGFSALAEESWSSYTKGVAAWVEKASQVGAGRLGCRRQRAEVDVRRLDGRVRPVPEGDEAGRRAWPMRASAPQPPTRPRVHERQDQARCLIEMRRRCPHRLRVGTVAGLERAEAVPRSSVVVSPLYQFSPPD